MTVFPLFLEGFTDGSTAEFAASSSVFFDAQGDGPTPSGPATPGAGTQGPATPGVGGTTGAATPAGNPMQSLMMFALIGAVIWFLIFAPERKARKKR